MIMSNENQYLRPDYLTPLPSLDAKNSPLALLAQTCSQIGSDAPAPQNGKTNSDKIGNHHKKTSSSLSSTSSSSSDHGGGGGGGGRDKRSPSLSSSSSSSCSNSGSPPGRTSVVHNHLQPTPITPVTTTARSSFKPYESCVLRPAAEVAAAAAAAAAATTNATSISLDATIRRATPVAIGGAGDRCSSKESASSRKSPAEDAAAASRKHGEQSHNKHSSSSAASVAALMAAAGYPSAHHHPQLSAHPHHHHHMAALGGSPLMSPYFRSGAGAPPLPCRDPYCAGCQLAAHLAAGKQPPQPAATCPAGCTQCDASPKTVAAAAAAAAAAHHHHQQSAAHHQHQQQHQQQHHHHTMAAAYAHAQLAALAAAASQLPYVCSWMGADLPSYCGKRFGTSDELLQHLRTHTSDPAAALPLLQRSYPTPPLSPSAAAAVSRYHPYASGKHHSPYGFPSGYPSSPLAMPPHPGLLPPYFPAVAYSPYAAAAAAAAAPRLGTSPHT
ncbi:zinc finger protein Elbow-like [Rhopalosiphum maidis]|uniref:zinc finger protein Elbow-like n=1 Tax=Rhopalosiphum maidis TaxID=43146 RepID=UPI000F00F050|nr:zinc finger protein Elbow-like [Rhopalosiphum maidis]